VSHCGLAPLQRFPNEQTVRLSYFKFHRMNDTHQALHFFLCFVFMENILKINNVIFILPFARQISAFTRRLYDIGHRDFMREDQVFKQGGRVEERLKV